MKDIINKINDYLKTIDESYEVWSYAKLDNKYIFSYMSKIENPIEYMYTEKVKNNYYTPIMDNTNIEYDIETHQIRTITISNNLEVMSKLNFINIKDTE